MVVPKLKNSSLKQKLLLFCAKDEKDKNNWINVLRDLNDRLFQSAQTRSASSESSITSLMVSVILYHTFLFVCLVLNLIPLFFCSRLKRARFATRVQSRTPTRLVSTTARGYWWAATRASRSSTSRTTTVWVSLTLISFHLKRKK